MAGPAGEQFVPRRRIDHAELQRAAPDEGDRHAPARQPADEGLGAVDGIDHPDALVLRKGRAPRFFAEKRVLGKGPGKPRLYQQLGIEVSLAGHVLRTLALDRKAGAVVEIAERQFACIADQREPEVVAARQRHAQSLHSQAAPRTPLASPCLLRRIGVWNTVEKVRRASAGGKSS